MRPRAQRVIFVRALAGHCSARGLVAVFLFTTRLVADCCRFCWGRIGQRIDDLPNVGLGTLQAVTKSAQNPAVREAGMRGSRRSGGFRTRVSMPVHTACRRGALALPHVGPLESRRVRVCHFLLHYTRVLLQDSPPVVCRGAHLVSLLPPSTAVALAVWILCMISASLALALANIGSGLGVELDRLGILGIGAEPPTWNGSGY